LTKKVEELTVKPVKEKKVRVGKWIVEHDKVVADVEPLLATIKTFDCLRLFWLAQKMAEQKRECIDRDTFAQGTLNNYSKWICATKKKGKLCLDVSVVGCEQGGQQEEDEEEEDMELDFAEYE
jgi:hypothetical protein